MRSTCPDREILHSYVDRLLSAPARASLDRHLIACSDCRDHVRLLRRIEAFASPQGECILDADQIVTRAREQAIPEIIRRAAGAQRPSGNGTRIAAGFAAALIGAAIVIVAERFGAAAASFSGETVAQSRAVAPDAVERQVPAPALEPIEFTGSLTEAVARAYDAAPSASDGSQNAERLWVAHAAESVDASAALLLIAQRAGRDADVLVGRLGRAAGTPPLALAEALAATRIPRTALSIVRLLPEEAGMRRRLLLEVPGDEATRLVVNEWMRDEAPAEFDPALLERDGLAVEARRHVLGGTRGTRVRAWSLLGHAGEKDAVPALEAMLDDGGERLSVVSALAGIGTPRAFVALARGLPLVGDGDDAPADPAVASIRRTLRANGGRAAAALCRAIGEAARGADRRRLLVAAGMTRDPLAIEEARRALARPQDRRAAVRALGFAGAADAVPALHALALGEEFGTRRDAMRALAEIGGADATLALARCAEKERDRRFVVDLLARGAEEAAVPALIVALRQQDTREIAADALRRRAGRGAPEGSDWRTWSAYFDGRAKDG